MAHDGSGNLNPQRRATLLRCSTENHLRFFQTSLLDPWLFGLAIRIESQRSQSRYLKEWAARFGGDIRPGRTIPRRPSIRWKHGEPSQNLRTCVASWKLKLTSQQAFTLHNVEALLTEQSLASTKDSSVPTLKTFTKTHRLTSLQLLSALATTIPLELSKLKFDYFAMHEQSIALLRRLKDALDPDLRKYVGPMYLENESQLPFVGLYVVMVACASLKSAEHLGMDMENVESKLLEKAGLIFDEFVQEQGV
jgi:hypothetical protein